MIFLDTCAVIDLLRGNKSVLKIISDEVMAVSEMTEFEVFSGSYLYNKNELVVLEEFFDNCVVLPLISYRMAARLDAELKKGGVQIPESDILIGSCAIQHSFDSIVTNDKKHFQRIPGLGVVCY